MFAYIGGRTLLGTSFNAQAQALVDGADVASVTFSGLSLAELEDITVPELPLYARDGIYVCCKDHDHSSGCGRHLWIFANANAPVPTHQQILKTMKKEVPHFNGNGTHS